MSEEIKYCVVTAENFKTLDFDCIAIRSSDYCPSFKDGAFRIVKYVGPKPRCLYGEAVYTANQIDARKSDPSDDIYEPDPAL